MEKAFNTFEVIDIFYIIVDYVLLFVIRAIIVLILMPILNKLGYGLPWQDSVVVIWGGLRGTVGLALALQLTNSIDNSDKIMGKVGEKILLHMAGIVLLTLLVNATTMTPLLKMLGISEISGFKKGVMRNAIKRLNTNKQETWRMLKTDRFLVDADWQLAEDACVIPNPYAQKNEEDDPLADEDERVNFSI